MALIRLLPASLRGGVAETAETKAQAEAGEMAGTAYFTPPMRQTSFHSLSVTGCTDRRKLVTSDISLSLGLALQSASVTGLGTSFTAWTSTNPKIPFSS